MAQRRLLQFLGVLVLTSRWCFAQSVTGNNNITLTNTSGTTNIRVGSPTVNNYSFNYDNKYGLSEDQMKNVVASLLREHANDMKALQNSLSKKLDQVGLLIKTQTAELEKRLDELREQAARLPERLRTENQAAIDAQTEAIKRKLADLRGDWTTALDERIDVLVARLSRATEETLTHVMEVQRRLERQRRREELRALSFYLAIGPELDFRQVGFTGDALRATLNLDGRFSVWAMSPEVSVELHLGGFVGGMGTNTVYEDGAGSRLDETHRTITVYGVQAGLGTRLLRSAPVCLLPSVGWRFSGGGASNGNNPAHGGPTVEVGSEVRLMDGFAVGLSLLAMWELKSTQTIYKYTGVGAETRSAAPGGEFYGGTRVYATYGW